MLTDPASRYYGVPHLVVELDAGETKLASLTKLIRRTVKKPGARYVVVVFKREDGET